MSIKYNYQSEEIKKKKDFSKQMMDTGSIPNLAAALIIVMYTFCFAELPYQTMTRNHYLIIFAFVAVVFTVLETIIAPKTNYVITCDIAAALKKEGKTGLTKEERTSLIRELNRCPRYIMIEVASCFIVASIAFMIFLKFLLGIDLNHLLFMISIAFFGSYEAGVLAYTYAQRLCSKISKLEARKELDYTKINKDKFYGLNFFVKLMLLSFAPFVIGTIMNFCYFLMEYRIFGDFAGAGAKGKIVFFVLMSITVSLSLIPVGILGRKNTKFTNSINANLENMLAGNISKNNLFISDFEDEASYNYYLVGKNMRVLETLVFTAQEYSRQIQKSTELLNETSSGIFSDSVTQSKYIEECVFYMDRKKDTLGSVANDFVTVEKNAISTQKKINEDSQLVQKNSNQMMEISQANIETIVGIKKLSEQIESVWKIIETIEQLAQKTRIIAFNAELEATASGEIGQNFHIVANEIRRLVSQILNSVKEIREGITEIQHFSDNLIISSEGGTEKIREGSEQFAQLEEKINELKISSEVTSETISDIKTITNTQAAAILQISATLKNITTHFGTLKDTSKETELTSSKLNDIASKFTQFKKEEV